VKIRQSYAEVMASQKKMEKQKEAAEALTAEWLGRAQLALSKGICLARASNSAVSMAVNPKPS